MRSEWVLTPRVCEAQAMPEKHSSVARKPQMQYRKLGRSGLDVSVVGLGCNNFGGRADLEASRATVHKALELGITLLDTADVYSDRGGSETALGKILGPKRKDIVLASKFGMAMDDAGRLKGGSRRYIMSAVEASLKRLQTDWLDLYQIHRPDPSTPMDETLRALDDLVRHGKVRYIGCSNLPAWQVVDALWRSRAGGFEAFVSAQDEYSLLRRGAEDELIPALSANGVGLLPYYPLASGLLTGKYKRGEDPPEDSRWASYNANPAQRRRWNDRIFDALDGLEPIVEAKGVSMSQFALAWAAATPGVTSPIIGPRTMEQLEDNLKAFDVTITPDDKRAVDAVVPPGTHVSPYYEAEFGPHPFRM